MARAGAAIATPREALASADELDSAGQAPTDLAILLGGLFVAVNLETLVKGVYLGFHGELAPGLQMIVARVARDLQWPLALLLVGFVAITAIAGRRRDIGRDSDLACVAFVPVVAVGALAALWQRYLTPIDGAGLGIVIGMACAWFGIGVALAIRQAWSRPDES